MATRTRPARVCRTFGGGRGAWSGRPGAPRLLITGRSSSRWRPPAGRWRRRAVARDRPSNSTVGPPTRRAWRLKPEHIDGAVGCAKCLAVLDGTGLDGDRWRGRWSPALPLRGAGRSSIQRASRRGLPVERRDRAVGRAPGSGTRRSGSGSPCSGCARAAGAVLRYAAPAIDGPDVSKKACLRAACCACLGVDLALLPGVGLTAFRSRSRRPAGVVLPQALAMAVPVAEAGRSTRAAHADEARRRLSQAQRQALKLRLIGQHESPGVILAARELSRPVQSRHGRHWANTAATAA